MKQSLLSFFTFGVIFLVFIGCNPKQTTMNGNSSKTDTLEQQTLSFGKDVYFLRKYTDVIVLQDSTGQGKVAVSAALQGRVMTSTSDEDNKKFFHK